MILLKIAAPRIIGRMGEKGVIRLLNKLDNKYYTIINDLLLHSDGNTYTTQIDHVVISEFGIFCIETKGHKGWILGNARQKFWTQVNYKNKTKFYNPLRQNYAHTKTLENLLGEERIKAPIVSLVAFPYADKIEVTGSEMVGYGRDVFDKIASYAQPIYSPEEKNEIVNLLQKHNIDDNMLRKHHRAEVNKLVQHS